MPNNTKYCSKCYDRNFLVECACGWCHRVLTKRDNCSRLRIFVHGHHSRLMRYHDWQPNGKDHYNWKGGKWLDKKGYVHVSLGHHRSKDEHIIIMENHLGRRVRRGELVHHKNEIKHDNRLENLELLTWQTHPPHHFKRNPLNGRFMA